MKKFPVLLFALATLLQAMPSDTCNQNTWVTNGYVDAIVPAGDKVYIGGDFTQVGPYTGFGVPINSSTGAPLAAFPKINGPVYAACADSNGGWFVGGQFTSVGGVARNNIAHILSSGSVDPSWNPNANGYCVYALAVSGTTVYAGGAFQSIGGQSRNCAAALDATTGNVLAWNPNANSDVLSLAVNGTTVYAGGQFTSIGGQSRSRIAALDATTGNILAWNPNAVTLPSQYYNLCQVTCLAVSGEVVYAAGLFDSIGGQKRQGLAALDATTGNALAWNPNPNGAVSALAVSGTIAYIGGSSGVLAVYRASSISQKWMWQQGMDFGHGTLLQTTTSVHSS